MPQVTLQFQNLFHLLEYIDLTGHHGASLDTKKLTLSCEATEADLELAKEGFGAELIHP